MSKRETRVSSHRLHANPALAFLAVLLLEVQGWKEWAPFTKFHSNRAPVLIEIDIRKTTVRIHCLFCLAHRGETGSLESTQNLMRLFSISGFCCVLIGVRVHAISAWLHVVIVRVNWIIHTGEWLTGGEHHFLAQTQRFCPNFSRKECSRAGKADGKLGVSQELFKANCNC